MNSKLSRSEEPKELALFSNISTDMDAAFMKDFADTTGSGLAHMDPRDVIVVPQLLLNQGSSNPVKQGRAMAGSFWNTATESPVSAPITVVPLFTFMSRTRWAPIGSESQAPLCSSTDATNGIGNPGGFCNECPARKVWSDQSKRMIGECDLSYSFIFYVMDIESAVLMHFSKSKTKLARQIVKLLAAPPKLSIYCYAFKLATALDENAGGVSYQNISLDKFSQTNDTRLTLSDEKFRPYLVQFKQLHEHYTELHRNGKLLPKYDRQAPKDDDTPTQTIAAQASDTKDCPF